MWGTTLHFFLERWYKLIECIQNVNCLAVIFDAVNLSAVMLSAVILSFLPKTVKNDVPTRHQGLPGKSIILNWVSGYPSSINHLQNIIELEETWRISFVSCVIPSTIGIQSWTIWAEIVCNFLKSQTMNRFCYGINKV